MAYGMAVDFHIGPIGRRVPLVISIINTKVSFYYFNLDLGLKTSLIDLIVYSDTRPKENSISTESACDFQKKKYGDGVS